MIVDDNILLYGVAIASAILLDMFLNDGRIISNILGMGNRINELKIRGGIRFKGKFLSSARLVGKNPDGSARWLMDVGDERFVHSENELLIPLRSLQQHLIFPIDIIEQDSIIDRLNERLASLEEANNRMVAEKNFYTMHSLDFAGKIFSKVGDLRKDIGVSSPIFTAQRGQGGYSYSMPPIAEGGEG